MKNYSEKLWYTNNIFSVLLTPLSWIFCFFAYLRRQYFKSKVTHSLLPNTFIIVVGNITVGGAGKTPFVSYLVQRCMDNNLKTGVISRGYGRDEDILIEVQQNSVIEEVGDEALMLKQQTNCPIAVAKDRSQAAQYLYGKYALDVIISDDGLQHYKLPRDFEIVVVDGEREFGNGRQLPAGPLREPVSRLQSVDLVVCNGKNEKYDYRYLTQCEYAFSLSKAGFKKKLDEFKISVVHAVAGIGFPDRFFNMLKMKGIKLELHAFADHYFYASSDLEFDDDLPILMTEKDAVKCKSFATENMWYVPITVIPNEKLNLRISSLLEEIS